MLYSCTHMAIVGVKGLTLTMLLYVVQLQVRCGQYVTSAVDIVRRACSQLLTRRPQTRAPDTSVDQRDVSPSEERKCGDGVDCACVDSPTHAAPATTTTTTDDVINSDDDTLTSSTPADCVTESSALTYTRRIVFSARHYSIIQCMFSALYAIARPSVCLSVTRLDHS